MHGISIESATEEYVEDHRQVSQCDTQLQTTQLGNEYLRLTVYQMSPPFLFFATCVILATILQLGMNNFTVGLRHIWHSTLFFLTPCSPTKKF